MQRTKGGQDANSFFNMVLQFLSGDFYDLSLGLRNCFCILHFVLPFLWILSYRLSMYRWFSKENLSYQPSNTACKQGLNKWWRQFPMIFIWFISRALTFSDCYTVITLSDLDPKWAMGHRGSLTQLTSYAESKADDNLPLLMNSFNFNIN